MTDILPYANLTEHAAIRKSMVRKELPADLGSIDVPDYVLLVLQHCWKHKGEKRPSIEWCQKTLSAKPLLLFDNISSDPSTTVVDALELSDATVCGPHYLWTWNSTNL